MQRVGIETAGVGGIREIAGTVKQVGRLAGDQHDRPGRTEAHDLIERQHRTALQMLPRAAAAVGSRPNYCDY